MSRTLRISLYVKLFLVTIVITFVTVFGVAYWCGNYNLSVIAEWIVGLVFTFYMWSFIIDFFAVVESDEKSDKVPLLHSSWDEELGLEKPARARVASVRTNIRLLQSASL